MIIFKKIMIFIGYILRNIEVMLCLRRTPYKTHRFPKKKASCEYYYNKVKFRQPYA